MGEDQIIQVTVDGTEIIFKQANEEIFYRPADEYGEWRPGIPDGAVWSDIQSMLDAAAY